MNYKILSTTISSMSPSTDVEMLLNQFDLSYTMLDKQDESLLKQFNDMFVFNLDYKYLAIKDTNSVVGLAVLEMIKNEGKLIFFGLKDERCFKSEDGHVFRLDELLYSCVLDVFADKQIDVSLYKKELENFL